MSGGYRSSTKKVMPLNTVKQLKAEAFKTYISNQTTQMQQKVIEKGISKVKEQTSSSHQSNVERFNPTIFENQ